MLARTLSLLSAAMFATSIHAATTNQQLTIGTTQEFETLNPVIYSMSASEYISLLVNRPLTTIDADWRWVCVLCERLPSLENGLARLVSDQGKTRIAAEWHLRPNLKWGDGKPITAKDFVLAWEIAHSPKVSVPNRDLYDRIDSITVDSSDPLKFTTVFREARYDFYQLPLEPLPSHIEGPIWEKAKLKSGAYEKQTAYATAPLTPGLYNGPYLLSEIKLGNHVVVQRNPFFYGKAPEIGKIVLKLIPNSQALEAALLAGDIDMINELGLSFDQAVDLDKKLAQDPAKKDQFRVLFRDGLTYEHVDLNLRNPILADKNVRKALVYALDRKQLSLTLFDGKQAPAMQYFHPLDAYYSEDVVRYDFDPKKAASLLDHAGWKVGSDGIRVKDAKPLELNVMTTTGNKAREKVEEYMQEQYRKIGIKLTIKNQAARVFFADTVGHGAFPALAMYAWQSSPDEPPRPMMHSSQIPAKSNGYGGQNYGGWSNPRVDQILDEVYREFDPKKRQALMAELMRIYTDEVPAIPLYLRSEIAVVPAKLSNFRIMGHQYLSTQEAEAWTLGPQAH